MKHFKKISIIVSLITVSYMPLCFLSAEFFDCNIKITHPVILSVINLSVAVFTIVCSFAQKTNIGLSMKIISAMLIPISAVNFSLYFIFSEGSATAIISSVTFVIFSVAATKNIKPTALRIIISIGCIAISIVTFVVSLIFAIALGLGKKDAVAVELSPDKKYRAELTEQSSIINNGYTLNLFCTENDTRLPFIHIFPNGKELWSGKVEEIDSFYYWKNNNTVVINGNEIKIE